MEYKSGILSINDSFQVLFGYYILLLQSQQFILKGNYPLCVALSVTNMLMNRNCQLMSRNMFLKHKSSVNEGVCVYKM